MASKNNEKYYAILEGALKVFAENGFHRSQVSKIASAAGVADGTIYLYFNRKEDILIGLYKEKLGEIIGKMKTEIERCANAKEALHAVCRIHFDELENNLELAYVTQIELRQNDLGMRKEIGKIVKTHIQLLEGLVEKGMKEGDFRTDLNPKLIRLLIFGALDEVVTSWLISGRKYTLASQLDETVRFLLRGMEA